MLRHKEIVGVVEAGRQGIGYVTQAYWSRAIPQERRTLFQTEIRPMAEEGRQKRTLGLGKQSKWTCWRS